MDRNIQFVVYGKTADGVEYRGIQKAWYAHPAIEFFAKANGVHFVAASAEKLDTFNHFLAKGLRKPLESN